MHASILARGMDALDLPHLDQGPRSGRAVLLLHGFPLDHHMWAPQKDALVAAGHRVLLPDLRGLGKAPLGKGPSTMEAIAGDALRLADRAGVRSFALAGFSLGGYAALALARMAPERVGALALVDTRADADSDEGRTARHQTIERVKKEGVGVVADAMLPKLLTSAAPAELRARVDATMRAQRPEGVIAALEGLAARRDQRDLLPALRVPTLIVVGEKDELTPPSASEAMAKAMPPARLVVVPGAAHLTTLERSDDVTRALIEWLG